MAKCVKCKYLGQFFYKGPSIFGSNIHAPEFISEMKQYGFHDSADLFTYYMKCQAPGGGPTPNPIALKDALQDEPCAYFKIKN